MKPNGTKTGKRGRPLKSLATKRSRYVAVRLTPAEHAEALRLSQAAQDPLGNWVRKQLRLGV
jgi:hypothetical protein